MRKLLPAIILFFTASGCFGQSIPKGNLFIIGGGDRTIPLMKELMQTAALGPKDYVAILPMSSEEPDSSYYYIKEDFLPVCTYPIVNLNFNVATANDQPRLDSLMHARLIFITGGDQIRFMKVVLNTPIYEAIWQAYRDGATIAGTSAGAAVMSRKMITGNQVGDSVYHETFRKLRTNNIEFKEGLGLLDSSIVDQHFVVRSRYNRLFSALALYPQFTCVGIDESTAIIVHGKKATVAGDGQVILISHPASIVITESGLIKFKDLHLDVLTAGEKFDLK